MAAAVEVEIEVGPDLIAAQDMAAVGADKGAVAVGNGEGGVELSLNVYVGQGVKAVNGQPVLILYGRNPDAMTAWAGEGG
jgi:hypothetical protein